jgi:hypothetical protein
VHYQRKELFTGSLASDLMANEADSLPQPLATVEPHTVGVTNCSSPLTSDITVWHAYKVTLHCLLRLQMSLRHNLRRACRSTWAVNYTLYDLPLAPFSANR